MKILNLKKFVILSMCVGALFFQSCQKDDVVVPDQTSNSAVFKEQMRYLWSDHAVWTRDVIVAILDQSPVTEASLTRLLANQVDIGNAIKPYYGEAGGQALTDLLTEHIVVAGDLLIAARGGDASFDEIKTKWYKNGDDIAIFLNSANPENWGLEHMKQHMKDHLDFTLAEAVAHLQGNYPDEIKAYDSVYEQLMSMSDLIADGIVKQFHDKF
jgi:hypothetical protein